MSVLYGGDYNPGLLSGRVYGTVCCVTAGNTLLASLGMLVANLGQKTFITARDLYTALLARNYQGQLVMRQPQQRVSAKRLLAILIVLIGLAMTAML